MDLQYLLNIILDYIVGTETTVNANLIYLTFNIHAAASETDPTLPAPVPAKLPEPANLVGQIISTNLSAFIYSSKDLQSERGNLNNSWYKVQSTFRPVEDYYKTSKNVNGIVSTEDGWPSESYIELTRYKRLLLQWGTVDPQMGLYNFSGDDSIIFPQEYLRQNQTHVTANSAGNVTNGCLLGNEIADLSKINASLATVSEVSGFNYSSSASTNLTTILNLTTNLVNCGITTLLNTSLLNVTADENPFPYRNFSYASFWAWAPGEPRNSTLDTGTHEYRCANTKLELNGRWTSTVDCSHKLLAACRVPGDPYNFTVTDYPISFSFAPEACLPNSFAVPRTALENSYLTQTIKQSGRDLDGHGVWVDWSSPEEGCWVSGNITVSIFSSFTCNHQD
jgi:hypothetical protein